MMIGAIDAVSSAIAGLTAHTRLLNASAHNVANVSTKGFEPTRSTITQNSIGLPEAQVTNGPAVQPDTAPAYLPSGTRLVTETINMMVAQRGFEASARFLRTESEAVGSLLDVVA